MDRLPAPPEWGAPQPQVRWRPRRVHAPYWTWRGNKRGAELGVVKQLARELRRDGRDDLRRLRSFAEDPPDCEGVDGNGALVAFEVRELVDQASAARGQGGERISKRWHEEEVLRTIEHIIRAKGGIRYDRDRYDRVVLVICTDERFISYERFGPLLDAARWPATYSLDDAYLIFPHSSRIGRCPCVQLRTSRVVDPARLAV